MTTLIRTPPPRPEITPAMERAGVEVFRDGGTRPSLQALVRDIYETMEATRIVEEELRVGLLCEALNLGAGVPGNTL